MTGTVEFSGNELRYFADPALIFAAPFPSSNHYEGNEVYSNLLDVLDFDPVCNDAWVNNTVGTAFAASGACIQ